MGLIQTMSDDFSTVTLDELCRTYCLQVLQRSGGNMTRAAMALGITRGALLKKLNRWGYGRPDRQPPYCIECRSTAPDHRCPAGPR